MLAQMVDGTNCAIGQMPPTQTQAASMPRGAWLAPALLSAIGFWTWLAIVAIS